MRCWWKFQLPIRNYIFFIIIHVNIKVRQEICPHCSNSKLLIHIFKNIVSFAIEKSIVAITVDLFDEGEVEAREKMFLKR